MRRKKKKKFNKPLSKKQESRKTLKKAAVNRKGDGDKPGEPATGIYPYQEMKKKIYRGECM